MVWATFWAFFSQTHPVTLVASNASNGCQHRNNGLNAVSETNGLG
jgi:hypothetical protein